MSPQARHAQCQSQRLTQALCVDTATIEAKIEELQGLLNTDPIRVNAFFLKHLSPIVCAPIKEIGQRFYRARGAARGDELLTLLGLESPYDFRGCRGAQSPIANVLSFEVDLI